MDRNPATDATLPKYKAEEREIWTAEMLMQAIDACENKWLKVAFHLAFAATVRTGELLGLTWDCVDISEEAISENRAYVFINKQVERVSKEAVEELDSKEVILIFPSQRKNGEENKNSIPEGVDPELLMKVLGNPEMAALITSLAKTIK